MNSVAGRRPTGAVSVVHVITGLGTGGAETMLYRLLAVLDLGRFRCRVVSLGDHGRLGHAI